MHKRPRNVSDHDAPQIPFACRRISVSGDRQANNMEASARLSHFRENRINPKRRLSLFPYNPSEGDRFVFIFSVFSPLIFSLYNSELFYHDIIGITQQGAIILWMPDSW